MALSKLEKRGVLTLLQDLMDTLVADDVGILWDFEDDLEDAINIMKRDIKND